MQENFPDGGRLDGQAGGRAGRWGGREGAPTEGNHRGRLMNFFQHLESL